jgi:hypothetical protein
MLLQEAEGRTQRVTINAEEVERLARECAGLVAGNMPGLCIFYTYI